MSHYVSLVIAGTSWRWADFLGRSWSRHEFLDSQECTSKQRWLNLTAQEPTTNLLQNVTRYVIPEVCVNITYSIVSAKRDAFRDASNICKTRGTSVTVIPLP
jgi:hypothetical protein